MPRKSQAEILKLVIKARMILAAESVSEDDAKQFCELFSDVAIWHFEESVAGLVDLETGEPTFRPDEAAVIQEAMEILHERLGERFEEIACDEATARLGITEEPEPAPKPTCEHGWPLDGHPTRGTGCFECAARILDRICDMVTNSEICHGPLEGDLAEIDSLLRGVGYCSECNRAEDNCVCDETEEGD